MLRSDWKMARKGPRRRPERRDAHRVLPGAVSVLVSGGKPRVETPTATAEALVSAPPEEVDVEVALLALLAIRDVGPATEPVYLDTLSPTEKRVLLRLLRDSLGLGEGPAQETAAE